MLKQDIDLYKIVEQLSEKESFVDFGIAKAEEVSDQVQQHYLQMLHDGCFADMQYLSNNISKRFNPQLLVEGAKSILVFLAPYSLPDNLLKKENFNCKIAQYALGKDYHKVIKDKLFKIMEELKILFPNFYGRAFTDSAPILERFWAVKAGLGFIGKNNFLINKNCGIKNLIGIIITNIEFPTTDQLFPNKKDLINGKKYCGKCTKCLDACKSGALCTPYKIDARKCVSYLTIENKNLKKHIFNGLPNFYDWYFGCDVCLNACPWNSKNKEGWKDFYFNWDILKEADVNWWENLSENEFNTFFKDSPLLRGGLENIKAAIAWQKQCDLKEEKDNGKF